MRAIRPYLTLGLRERFGCTLNLHVTLGYTSRLSPRFTAEFKFGLVSRVTDWP